MIIWKEMRMDEEKRNLDEMAIRVIGSSEDGLPFKVTVKSPDKGKYDHAHIMKLGTKDTELGTFVITKNPPQQISDLVGYTEGHHKGLVNLFEDQLQALVTWASRKNALLPVTNWQALQYEYAVNRKS
jgi:hypothetical protein